MNNKIIHKRILVFGALLLFMFSCDKEIQSTGEDHYDEMIIRIAELTIEPDYLQAYLDILKEESEASVRLEPGVLCIYPMYVKENPTRIRLLEIYKNQQAYEDHLNSPHFKKYKSSTSHMVESLKLIDMEAIDPESMPLVFAKISN